MTAVGVEAPPSAAPRRRSRAAPPPLVPRPPLRRRIPYGPIALLLPAAAVLAVIFGWPMIRLIIISFQSYGLRQIFGAAPAWTGFANYTSTLGSSEFWTVVLRTVLFAAACVSLTLGFGMLVALMLRRVGKVMRATISAVMILAWVMPSVTAAVVWQWMFQPIYGVINWLLTAAGFGDFTSTDFFNGPPLLALTIIVLMIVWQAIPFVALTLYAGLTQIPNELYEAARVDGAGRLRVFRAVTFPLLKPVILLVGVLSVIWDFNVFNQIQILTPLNAGTEIIGVYTYVTAFVNNAFGLGAAIAVISVILLGVFAGYYVRQLVRTGELA